MSVQRDGVRLTEDGVSLCGAFRACTLAVAIHMHPRMAVFKLRVTIIPWQEVQALVLRPVQGDSPAGLTGLKGLNWSLAEQAISHSSTMCSVFHMNPADTIALQQPQPLPARIIPDTSFFCTKPHPPQPLRPGVFGGRSELPVPEKPRGQVRLQPEGRPRVSTQLALASLWFWLQGKSGRLHKEAQPPRLVGTGRYAEADRDCNTEIDIVLLGAGAEA